MTQVKFTLKCPQCGSTRFTAATAKPGPADTVTCAQCGTSVDLAAEKKRLETEARDAIEDRNR
jgi:ribosomal protein S27AE